MSLAEDERGEATNSFARPYVSRSSPPPASHHALCAPPLRPRSKSKTVAMSAHATSAVLALDHPFPPLALPFAPFSLIQTGCTWARSSSPASSSSGGGVDFDLPYLPAPAFSGDSGKMRNGTLEGAPCGGVGGERRTILLEVRLWRCEWACCVGRRRGGVVAVRLSERAKRRKGVSLAGSPVGCEERTHEPRPSLHRSLSRSRGGQSASCERRSAQRATRTRL